MCSAGHTFRPKTTGLSHSTLKWPSSVLLRHCSLFWFQFTQKHRPRQDSMQVVYLWREKEKRRVGPGRKEAYVSLHFWGCQRKLSSLGSSTKHAEHFPELSIWVIKASFHDSLPASPHLSSVAPGVTKSPKCSGRGFRCVGEVPKAKSRKMGDRSLKWVPAWQCGSEHTAARTVTEAEFRGGL